MHITLKLELTSYMMASNTVTGLLYNLTVHSSLNVLPHYIPRLSFLLFYSSLALIFITKKLKLHWEQHPTGPLHGVALIEDSHECDVDHISSTHRLIYTVKLNVCKHYFFDNISFCKIETNIFA